MYVKENETERGGRRSISIDALVSVREYLCINMYVRIQDLHIYMSFHGKLKHSHGEQIFSTKSLRSCCLILYQTTSF